MNGGTVDQELLESRNMGMITPLMMAIESGDPITVQTALALGMSPLAVNNMGESCLEMARRGLGKPGGSTVLNSIMTAIGDREAATDVQREQMAQLAGPIVREFIDEMDNLR